MKKRTNALIAVLLLTSCPLVRAQQATSQDIAKVVRVRGNARSIANAAGSYSGAHYTISDELNAIVIRGQPDAVASVERTIQELDAMNPTMPANTEGRRNLEMVAYVIGGSREAIPGFEEINGAALAPVVKQLRAIFPYGHYSLLSTMLMRSAQDAKANSRGVMPSLSGANPGSYQIGFEAARASSENPVSIHVRGFYFDAQIALNVSSGTVSAGMQQAVNVSADVNLSEGQKLVVGKANVSNSDSCFFIVLSVRLVS